jgi:hypothetical protein
MFIHILLLAFSLAMPTEYISYTSEEGDYTLEVNNQATYLREPAQGGYTDNFTINLDTTSAVNDYVMTVTKVPVGAELDLPTLALPEVRDSFEANCNCKVSKTETIHYKHSAGVQYTYTMTMGTQVLKGYTFNVPKGSNLYALTFITSAANLSKFKPEFDHTVDSFVANK